MATLVQRLHDEGWKKGFMEGFTEGFTEGFMEGFMESFMESLKEGRAEGEAEGEANVLLRILERRFGEVPEGVAARILAADLEDIDRWVDAAFDADDVDNIFRLGATR